MAKSKANTEKTAPEGWLTLGETTELLRLTDRQVQRLEAHGLEARGRHATKRYHPRAIHWYAVFKVREKHWRATRQAEWQIDWLPMRLALLTYDLWNAQGAMEWILEEGKRIQIPPPPGGFKPAW